MKTTFMLAIFFVFVVGFATLAKADSVKSDDDDANALQSFRSMNRHHPHGFHLKYKKDDNDAGIDFDDFIWIGPGQSKTKRQLKSTSFANVSDSASTTDEIVAKGQDEYSGDHDVSAPPSTVPEPGTWVLLGTGLLMVITILRKRIRVT